MQILRRMMDKETYGNLICGLGNPQNDTSFECCVMKEGVINIGLHYGT